MPTFNPPVVEGIPWGEMDSDCPEDRLMRYYGGIPQGETVYKDHLGEWHQGQYPYQGGATYDSYDDGLLISRTTDDGLANAQVVYLGGHEYAISEAEAAELTAAGFGEYITP